jgi:hypothetical protein
MLLTGSQQASSFSPLHYALPPLATACLSFSEAGLGHTSSFHLHQLTPAGSDIIFSHATCTLPLTLLPLFSRNSTTSSSQKQPLLALLLITATAIYTEKKPTSSSAAASLASKRGIERNLVSACKSVRRSRLPYLCVHALSKGMHNSFPSPPSSLIEGLPLFHTIP